MNQKNDIEYLSEPLPVSMADTWYEVSDLGHFWVKWRFDSLLRSKELRPKESDLALEIGCGHGLVRTQLEQQVGCVVDACDLNEVALKLVPPGKGRVMVYDITQVREDMVGRYDSVYLMDVIEHIEDDTEFLRRSAEHLKPGGKIFINVPCSMKLWGNYDVVLGHYRRYTCENLRQVIMDAGLSPLSVYHWGFTLVPLIVMRNILTKGKDERATCDIGFKPPSAAFNTLLNLIRRVETSFPFNPPIGTSVMAVAQKT